MSEKRTFNRPIKVVGTLEATGAATLSGAVTASANLVSSGTTTLSGNTVLSGTTTLSGATAISGAATFSAATNGIRKAVSIVTTDTTLTAADSGKLIVLNSTTAINVALPATVAGLWYEFTLGAVTTQTGHTVDPVAADKIIGNGLGLADDAKIFCTPASDRVGDSITIVGDGVDGWYLTNVVGTWAGS